jgi:hypothetical protein
MPSPESVFALQKGDSRIGFVRLDNSGSFSNGDRWLVRIAFVRVLEVGGLPLLSSRDIYQVFVKQLLSNQGCYGAFSGNSAMTLGSVWSLVYNETSTSSVSFSF